MTLVIISIPILLTLQMRQVCALVTTLDQNLARSYTRTISSAVINIEPTQLAAQLTKKKLPSNP